MIIILLLARWRLNDFINVFTWMNWKVSLEEEDEESVVCIEVAFSGDDQSESKL